MVPTFPVEIGFTYSCPPPHREWDPQLGEEDALKQFERCQRQEQNFGDLFTGKGQFGISMAWPMANISFSSSLFFLIFFSIFPNFSAIVTAHSPDDVFARVLHTINEHSRPDIWVPTHEPLL